jgi:hypothetical protein
MLNLISLQGKAVYQNALLYIVIHRHTSHNYNNSSSRSRNINLNDSECGNGNAGIGIVGSSRSKQLAPLVVVALPMKAGACRKELRDVMISFRMTRSLVEKIEVYQKSTGRG